MTPDRLATCFEDCRAHLHEVARAIVGSRADADDVLQDAWLKAAVGPDDAIRSPAAWMTTMVRNLALDQRRHRRVTERHAAQDADGRHVPSVEDALTERLEAAAIVRRIVEALDRVEAATLLLQVVFDEDHATLAARTGRSVGATRVALHRALRRVRRRDRDGSKERCSDADRAAVDHTFAVCWQAIEARDATPLHALLASTLSAPVAMPASPGVPADVPPPIEPVPAVRVACVQVAGRYMLALRQGDRLISVLPIGVLESPACAVD